ncbi:hypothetical protein MMC11_005360 [Xylographa trunciseda]|nr:hypothetical protein [Xylographa trunciseda]
MPLLGTETGPESHRYQNGGNKSNLIHMPSPVAEVMPIAVVGMACRFPGELSGPKGLWDMCCEGRSAWSEIPKDRMNVDGFWHPDISKLGCFNNRGGHFIKEDIGLFDAPFFRINASEAKAMDPQQRLLLESTYESLENAGIPVHAIAGKRVGVYVGLASSDYAQLAGDESTSTYSATGLAPTLASNRLSYCFDFRGPSMTIDTACSSSLTALHLACQSLRMGESEQAIVGGCHLVLSPDIMISMSLLGLFSKDGRSYTYDNRSSGYGRGEGVATIVIKPLDDAIKAGDNIRAVIRNSGANQDGRTPGVTFPSQEAQIDLMKSVYHAVGLDCAETAYVEAHGTGTAVGDPIEAEAIATVFGSTRSPGNPVIVGSIKTNIGHTEATSGLAGIIKTVYMLENGLIPPNINFENAHERIYLQDWNMKVPVSLLPWPESSTRRASVCNFGFGGTNCHVILESSSSYLAVEHVKSQGEDHNGLTNGYHLSKTILTKGGKHVNGSVSEEHGLNAFTNRHKAQKGLSLGISTPTTSSPNTRVYVLSAFEKSSLLSQMRNMHTYLSDKVVERSCNLMQDLAFTLAQRRSLHAWRVAITASSQLELMNALQDEDIKPSRCSSPLKLAFVFTGQGAQWAAMGRELMRDYPVFASTIQDADMCLKGLGARWSLIDELNKDLNSSCVAHAYISQPAVTALQIALVNLMNSWNIKAVAVSGHSSGEIPAAYASGALSMEACMAIAYHRGVIAWTLESSTSARKGAMLAIKASSEEVESMLSKVKEGRVDIACYLSPSLIVASGDDMGIDELQSLSKSKDVLTTKLRVNVAYHSHHMRAVEADYLAALGHISHNESTNAQFWSSSRGHRIDTQSLDSSYWVDNLVNPVMLSQTLQKLCFPTKNAQVEGPIGVLIEIGPHSTFETPVKQIRKANAGSGSELEYMYTLKRGHDATQTMLNLASRLFEMGYEIDLAEVNFPRGSNVKVLIDLPTYPWRHNKRHWNESRGSLAHRMKPFPRHDLIGSLELDSNAMDNQWRNVFRLEEIPWLLDHKIESSPVFPFSGFMSMVIQAAFQRAICRGVPITSRTRYNLREISVLRSLVFQESSTTEVHITLRPNHEGTQRYSDIWDDFSISSWTEEQGWIEHCRGLVSVEKGREQNVIDGKRTEEDERFAFENWTSDIRDTCSTALDCVTMYDIWAKGGLVFGPTYRNIYEAHISPGQAVVSLRIPDTASRMPYSWESYSIIHPATLDTILQAVIYALHNDEGEWVNSYMPVFMKSLSVSQSVSHIPGDALQVYSTARYSDGKKMYIGSMTVFDATKDPGVPVVEVVDYTGSAISHRADSSTEASENRSLCFKLQWEPHLESLSPEKFDRVFETAPTEPDLTRIYDKVGFYYLRRCLDLVPEILFPSLLNHHKKLYTYLKQQEVLERGTSLALSLSNGTSDNEDDMDDLIRKVRSSGEMGEMICTMGNVLPEILRREAEPLVLMLANDLHERYFNNKSTLERNYAKAALYVDKMAHQNPQLKVIEIDAGDANATLSILETLGGTEGKLPRFSHYDFTKVSTRFLEKVQQKLKSWGELVSVKQLDIEQDPIDQGFVAESYDLVVCMDVGLNTNKLDGILRHIKKLLRPGGRLVLSESTSRRLSDYIAFGTLPAMWVETDSEEPRTSVIAIEQWDNLLKRSGFSGLDNGLGNQSGSPNHSSSLMFSTALCHEKPVYPQATVVLNGSNISGISIEQLQESLKVLTGCAPTITPLAQAKMEGKYCIVLEADDPILSNIKENQFIALQEMCSGAKGILWVVRGAFYQSSMPDANLVLGLARTIRSENTGLIWSVLDLDPQQTRSDADTADVIVQMFKTIFSSNASTSHLDMEFAEHDGIIKVPRIVPDVEKDKFIMRETNEPVSEPQPFVQDKRPLRLKMKTPGLLDSLYFADDNRLVNPIAHNMIGIDVKAVGMNFKDVMIGLGQIPYQDLGFECSGVVTALGRGVSDFAIGDRVCTMAGGCYANHIQVPDFTVQKFPEDMSFTIAASILTIFTTAHYSLINVAQLNRGESILIHAAAGGVGQSAVMLAQSIGAEVFITVGSTEKKEFMMNTYHIPVDHIFSSRDTTFERGIMRRTNNSGVDVILNSVASDALRITWNCLAPLGRFIEIGKKDMVQNSRLEMRKFQTMATFASVDLGVVIMKKPKVFQKTCADVMELLRTGALRPVSPITVYPMSHIEAALRLMQTGKHMGKIVIEAQSEDWIRALPAKVTMPAVHPDASYLITGGTGGLGRSTARWLVKQGARNIILASRSGTAQDNVRELIEDLAKVGATIAVRRCDVADKRQLETLIEESAKTMPPIRGIIHGVMVLRDSIFEMSTYSDYNAVMRPKVQGAWNLHHCLSTHPLSFFILLSSISGIAGTRGQAAYAASSTFLDAFAHYRVARGLPASSIDLGVVADVGYVAENVHRQAQITANANDRVREKEYHALLKAAICKQPVGSDHRQTITGCKLAQQGQSKASWVSGDSIWALLARGAESSASVHEQTDGHSTQFNIGKALAAVTSVEEGTQIVCEAIVTKVASISSIPMEEINAAKPMVSYGLDSLVAIELRNWLARTMEASVPMLKLLGGSPLMLLSRDVLKMSKLVNPAIFGTDVEGIA